jgi:hypothetical protein
MSDDRRRTESEAVDKLLMQLSTMELTIKDADDLIDMAKSRRARVDFYEDEHDRDEFGHCKRCGKHAHSRNRPYFGRGYVPPEPVVPGGGIPIEEWRGE